MGDWELGPPLGMGASCVTRLVYEKTSGRTAACKSISKQGILHSAAVKASLLAVQREVAILQVRACVHACMHALLPWLCHRAGVCVRADPWPADADRKDTMRMREEHCSCAGSELCWHRMPCHRRIYILLRPCIAMPHCTAPSTSLRVVGCP